MDNARFVECLYGVKLSPFQRKIVNSNLVLKGGRGSGKSGRVIQAIEEVTKEAK